MVRLVTHSHKRLCIDCAFCTDNGKPTIPGMLVCQHPKLDRYGNSAARYCYNTRWFEQGVYGEQFCGRQGNWFRDALRVDVGMVE